MEESIKILLSCNIPLFLEGLKQIIHKERRFEIIGEAHHEFDIESILKITKPHLLIINFSEKNQSISDTCKKIYTSYPWLPILIFLDCSNDVSIPQLIVNGVRGIIWKENTNLDLIDSIFKLANGKLFFENPDNCKYSQRLNDCSIYEKCLSERESEVAGLLADGLSYKEIGNQLNISPRTVESHKNNIMEKLQLNNLSELIKFSLINNL